jgi:hypothetical protein
LTGDNAAAGSVPMMSVVTTRTIDAAHTGRLHIISLTSHLDGG